MQPLRIEEKASIHLVGLPARFVSGLAEDTDAGEVIGPLWGRFLGRLGEVARSDGRRLYGYCRVLDEAERERADECAYVAGAPATPGAPVPEGMVAVDTPAALYAVFEHRGPIARFPGTLRAIYESWLPGSDYVANGRADLELYDERYGDGGHDSVMEYWVGVTPKA